jgi:hypothetical protein
MNSSMKKTTLNELKALPGLIRHWPEKRKHAFSLWPDGWPGGALVELCGQPGSGKTEVIFQFLSENPLLRTVWIEEGLSIYPPAFARFQIALESTLFIEVPAQARKDSFWVAEQILKSSLFDVLILTQSLQPKRRTETEWRRLQICTERSRALFLIVSREPSRAWPISEQFEVQRIAEKTPLEQTPLEQTTELSWKERLCLKSLRNKEESEPKGTPSWIRLLNVESLA